MNERMCTGMLEATRLTRAGQRLEATATIQRTLRGLLAPNAAADTTGRTTDAPIEGTFRVIDVAPLPTEVSVRGPDRRPCTATMAEVVNQTVARKTVVLGLQHYTRQDLEAVRAAGQKLQIQVLGLASIAEDVSPELALATIDSLVVLGALHASAAAKAALAALPPPGGADALHGREPAATELADTPPSPRAAGPTEAPTIGQPPGASERTEAPSRVPRPSTRLRATLRPPWRGYGGPVSRPRPLPDRTRDVVPDGGRFLTGSYTNQAGTRTYKLYIPSGHRGQALPLVVMLHGCTQTPDDFAAGTRMNGLAEEHQCFVVYPAQASAANGSKCWNWFKAADQHRGQGEPSIIAGITRQIVSTYPVDARRVYVAGLSAGGAMAVIMGMTYPDLYAAIGIHSGLAYAVAHDLPSAFAAMQQGGAVPARQRNDGVPGANPRPRVVPTIVFHGDRDTTVHPHNGDQVIAHWATIHAGGGPHTEAGTNPQVTVQRGQVPEGHAYTRTVYHDASGQAIMEQWRVHGAGHAWSGGSPSGSFTDPKGPDAAQEMIRFFYEHPQRETRGL